MQVLPIQALPNQAFSIVLTDNRWDISIKAVNGAISVSLTRNGDAVVENTRAVAGMRIIPSQYEEAGNFVITTINEEIPDYTKFGISQSFIYLNQAEIDAIRQPVTPPITAAFFDPLGALPLRFAPQGYVEA